MYMFQRFLLKNKPVQELSMKLHVQTHYSQDLETNRIYITLLLIVWSFMHPLKMTVVI
jgi:hypothetical protein